MYALVYKAAPLKPNAPSASVQVEKKLGECEQQGKVWDDVKKMCVVKQSTSIPKTGDTTNTMLYVVMGLVSLVAVAFVIKKKYQR